LPEQELHEIGLLICPIIGDLTQGRHVNEFGEAPPSRGKELASALLATLRHPGEVRVQADGHYWRVHTYITFQIDIALVRAVDERKAELRALQPTSWPDDVWNHQMHRRQLLLAEIR
jgi:hypothetical protein